MHQEFEPTRWVLEGMIPEGTILVAGKPKGGKSWFVLNLLLSTVFGQDFLERKVAHGGALYLALEDTPKRMQSRLKILLNGHSWDPLKLFEYRCDWPAGAEGARLLDEYLTAHPTTRTVAVDVLKKIRPRENAQRSGYDLDYEAISPWKSVADKHRITLIFVHHTRKAEADDVFDEISGTLGIAGSVDQMIVLKRISGSNDKMSALYLRGRDLEEDLDMGIDLDAGWWKSIGPIVQVRLNKARKEVLQLFETHDNLGTGDICELLGKKSQPSTSRLLTGMARDGLLRKNHDRSYSKN